MSLDRKTADAISHLQEVCKQHKVCNNCPLGGFTEDDMCVFDWPPKTWTVSEKEDGSLSLDIVWYKDD